VEEVRAEAAAQVAEPPEAVQPLSAPLRDAICVLLLTVSDLGGALVSVAGGRAVQILLRDVFDFQSSAFLTWVQASFLLFIAVSVGFLVQGLYRRREPFWERVRLEVKTLFVALLVAVVGIYMFQVYETPRSLVILSGACLLVAVPVLRMCVLWLLHRADLWARHVVVVSGEPEEGRALAEDLERDFALGYRVMRVCRPGEADAGMLARADEVVVATGWIAGPQLDELVSSLYRHARCVTVVPGLGDIPFGRGMSRFLFDERRMLLTGTNVLKQPANIAAKRAFDLFASLLGTVVLALPMGFLALAIRLDSPGRAVFSQERVGRRGRRFRCLKFRTMHSDAEARLEKVLAEDPARREEWEKYHKLKDDPRVTRVGRWLRKTSLDELPQLFNVLLGSMSLVGPRPLPEYHYEKFTEPYASDYLDVWPGITGLWQVSGRSEADVNRMAVLNSWYVRNWSLWLDVTLLLRTVPIVLIRRGAY
jgi:undecaprenyl-phosphate galactose phosphotransferase